jgi:D-3-phosphoglycerate dehydrogenase / 2-oxoglutarate reductase
VPRVLLTHGPESLIQYFGAAPLAALREVADVALNPGPGALDAAGLLAAARTADIVVLDRATPGPAALFDACPDLSAVCRVAVDIRNIDVAAASGHGVLVTQATPGFSDAVAEWIVGAMIDLARGFSRYGRTYGAGAEPAPHPGRQIGSMTVGIVGYGRIARRLAALLSSFGCGILAHDPHVADAPGGPALRPFANLLDESDIVVCLAAATPETENLFGRSAFAAMRPGAFFINAARGDLVDEEALAAALDSGRLAGAAMDVGRGADQRPSLFLAARRDVSATPHIGGNTPESVAHQAWCVVEQVRSLVRGELPSGAVNAASWRRALRGRPGPQGPQT